jgi:GT2 family glycosyltransferase
MLIAMAVWDTVENNRSWMTKASLWALAQTVDWERHRLIVVDNASCEATHVFYAAALRDSWPAHLPFTLLYNEVNLGAAAGINKAWRERKPGEHAVRIDNDCVIHQAGWADKMEEVFERDPSIGIVGLKRKDVDNVPWSVDYPSTLVMLPHEKGQPWLVVEEVNEVLGTCQGYNSALLDRIGYQHHAAGIYGFDDCLGNVRARLAGFKRVYLCGVEIDHIDNLNPKQEPYTLWKQKAAGEAMAAYNAMKLELEAGVRPLYYDGGFDAAA